MYSLLNKSPIQKMGLRTHMKKMPESKFIPLNKRIAYLEFTSVSIHRKTGIVHGTHEPNSRGHHIQHLVFVAHPQTLKSKRKRFFIQINNQESGPMALHGPNHNVQDLLIL